MPAIAYYVLETTIIAAEGRESVLAQALGRDLKGKASMALYALAVGLAFVDPWLSFGIYTLVAALWLVPDRRIERNLPKVSERR